MYSLAGYGEMIANRVRTGAYAEALRRTVKPGSVVLEIGTGPGIFAILACQLGARRVYAIESEEIIQVARETAAANGCADRIEFFEALSTSVELHDRVDIILSDLRGVLPQFGQHIPSIVDARRRFLKPDGMMIPQRDTLFAAIVEMKELYEEVVGIWDHNGFDQNLSTARNRAVSRYYKSMGKPMRTLSEPQKWTSLDYRTIENPDSCGSLQWTVQSSGTAHGILVWFDAELADGVTFSNAPGKPKTIYDPLLFPWIHPVPLAPGNKVHVELQAKLVGTEYVWRWPSQIETAGPTSPRSIAFDQSSLGGAIVSPAKLRTSASGYVPQLSGDGQLDRRILELMDGKATLEEIARRLATEFPQRFVNWQDALTSAGALSRKYSR